MGHRCCAAFSNRQEADELEQELDSLSDTQQALSRVSGCFVLKISPNKPDSSDMTARYSCRPAVRDFKMTC